MSTELPIAPERFKIYKEYIPWGTSEEKIGVLYT